MVCRDIYIKNYDWRIKMYFAITHYEIPDVADSLYGINCPNSIYEKAVQQMEKGEVNTGFTYSNKNLRMTITLIGKTDSGAEFLNSFTHELRHITDDIAQKCGLKMAGEKVAYLAGDIAMSVADVVCKMTCKHCRKPHQDE